MRNHILIVWADPSDLQLAPVFRQFVSIRHRFSFLFLSDQSFSGSVRGAISFSSCFNVSLIVRFCMMHLSYNIIEHSSVATVDGLNDRSHVSPSLIIGGDGPYIPFPSHSFLGYLGPQVSILLLDCRQVQPSKHLAYEYYPDISTRAERRRDQVCSTVSYYKVLDRLHQLPSRIQHLVVQLGTFSPLF
jgi:hypothetical protein